MTPQTAGTRPLNPANRLGLDYAVEAKTLPYTGPIYDVHTHLNTIEAARTFFEVADHFGVEKVWSMTQPDQMDAIADEFPGRIRFIAVPNYAAREKETTFTSDWIDAIETFAEKGAKICKLWAAPRGRDLSDALRLDSPWRQKAMKLARDAGMMFMVHIADPDTWFATHYADAAHYGTKLDQYGPLRDLLEQFDDCPWLAAHMGGYPEDLDFLQEMLDRYPHLHLDTSATKWMVRELSQQGSAFADFATHNAGRLLFGTDIVATTENRDFDLYASRYWALRTLMETDYDGPSPIVDPDLPLLDPTLPEHATAHLRGVHLHRPTLDTLYRGAAQTVLEAWEARQG
ncbi:MAG: amidohydrolase family protein [Phycisphaeraceae bacterium]